MPRHRPEREDPAVLKRRYPVEDVIARAGVRLRRSGGRLVGRCPFHEERTPSFTVYPDQGTYHCYGCGAHGDVFTFIMARERCSFAEAMARLTGGDLPPAPRPLAPPAEPDLTDRQRAILTVTARAYADDLTAARALDAALAVAPALAEAGRARLRAAHGVRRADAALAYLRARGVRDAVLAPTRVGWCEGDRLGDLAAGHGWAEAELVALGLLDGHGRERLAGRVVVPEVRAGQCAWLTGRAIGPDHPRRPKYLGVRAPRRALGLERAAGQALVIVVEGVIDYLVGLGWGLPVLALGGLGLRPDELAALRHARRLMLLLDADRAGRAEAARLAALIGPRARVVHPPPPAKDLADLAHLPDGRARLAAALGTDVTLPPHHPEDRHAAADR
jgi:DNA primase